MATNLKISVIMSVYNAEEYLSAAVESILNQTYRDFEFIIIEDASTDSSLNILESYAAQDCRISLIKNKLNEGAGGFIKNLNLGLKKATGSYIARMDADDVSDSSRFEKQIRFLETNPEVFMVGSDVQFIDEAGRSIKILSSLAKHEAICKKMHQQVSMYHPVLLWRNNGKIFYREKMLACEDYDLYFRLITDGYLLGNINETLLKYRILSNSLSRKSNQLIRYIFVEKARCFFKQRKEQGVDAYDSFPLQDYQNLLVPDYSNKAEDLIFGIKVALRSGDQEHLKLLLSKASRQYPGNFTFKYFKYLNNFPRSFQAHLLEILNK